MVRRNCAMLLNWLLNNSSVHSLVILWRICISMVILFNQKGDDDDDDIIEVKRTSLSEGGRQRTRNLTKKLLFSNWDAVGADGTETCQGIILTIQPCWPIRGLKKIVPVGLKGVSRSHLNVLADGSQLCLDSNIKAPHLIKVVMVHSLPSTKKGSLDSLTRQDKNLFSIYSKTVFVKSSSLDTFW